MTTRRIPWILLFSAIALTGCVTGKNSAIDDSQPVRSANAVHQQSGSLNAEISSAVTASASSAATKRNVYSYGPGDPVGHLLEQQLKALPLPPDWKFCSEEYHLAVFTLPAVCSKIQTERTGGFFAVTERPEGNCTADDIRLNDIATDYGADDAPQAHLKPIRDSHNAIIGSTWLGYDAVYGDERWCVHNPARQDIEVTALHTDTKTVNFIRSVFIPEWMK